MGGEAPPRDAQARWVRSDRTELGASSGSRLLAIIEQVWPHRRERREIAGLPAEVFEVVDPGRRSGPIRRAANELDRLLPAWVEQAAEHVAACAGEPTRPGFRAPTKRGPTRSAGGSAAAMCLLLACRPLREPSGVLRALDTAMGDPDSCFWLLVALAGTDTTEVRRAWLYHLRRLGAQRGPEVGAARWMAFVRGLLGGWLRWDDFRLCVGGGGALAHVTDRRGYRTALERLGLWSAPGFAKWYRQLVYEVAHQPDAALSFQDSAWIRDFPGEQYLWDALEGLRRQPDSWWHLHVLRWVSDVDPTAEQVVSRLAAVDAVSLCLLSLVRPDYAHPVGFALGVPEHASVVAWLRQTLPAHAPDPHWMEGVFADWVSTMGASFVGAIAALCSISLPGDWQATANPARRRRAFLREHLVPELNRLTENVLYVYAMAKQQFPFLASQARKGRPAALRALAYWPEMAEEAAPILLQVRRQGTRSARQAAEQALSVLSAKAGLAGPSRLERRVDLAAAWSDDRLDDWRSRVSWDIAGYQVGVSVSPGSVKIQVHFGGRRLASVPTVVRGEAAFEEVKECRARLARCYRYFRHRLEQAMVDQLAYSPRDLTVLMANPVVRSLLSRLAMTADGVPLPWALPDATLAGHELPPEMAAAKEVRIAHPVDLLLLGVLEQRQQQIVDSRTPQPLRQVFREVYLVGEEEEDSPACQRFAGHRVRARQAYALLRGRGYSVAEGTATREWPQHGLVAHLRWATSGDDAGRALGEPGDGGVVTTGAVSFSSQEWAGGAAPLRPRSGQACGIVPLGTVPPVVFSETLRDADLLVSRAAAGELGFSSQETRRLRGTLVQYLSRALGLTCVYVGGDWVHVLVEGKRATYRLHLGSGSVVLEHSRRSLDLTCLRSAPTHAVVGECVDAATAGIIRLVMALSRDDQIADPAFLRQLGEAGLPPRPRLI